MQIYMHVGKWPLKRTQTMDLVTENKITNKINGIDVDALQEAIEMVRANPQAGQTRWNIRSRWTDGRRQFGRLKIMAPAAWQSRCRL
jgi:hypothetical protein